jgi:alanyl-tRNA synthetase
VGATVHGIVDFDHRFSNMQQHTGEHIFSGLVHSRFGYDNVGFHLSDSEVTMDYNGVLTEDDIRSVEKAANEAIWHDLEVSCEFPSDEVLSGLDYRSKKELSGDIRIVTIPGVDICACCAPHVARTGQIGLLKVISCQNYKGGVRVSILCGRRALEFIEAEHNVIRDLTKLLTTGSDKILESVKRTADENYRLKGELSECREKLIDIEISAIDSGQEKVLLVKVE